MDLSGALRYYTTLTPVRWDALGREEFLPLRARTEAAGARWFALLRRYEIPDATPRLPGRWTHLGDVADASLWRLEPLERN